MILADVRDLRKRDLRSRRRRHQDLAQPFDVVAQFAGITDIDGITGAAFDRGGDVLSADGRHDDVLRIRDGQAVARQLVPAQVKIDEIASGHPLGEHRAGARHIPQQRFEPAADLLDFPEVRAEDLDADRRAHAGGQHVDARLDRHGPGVGHARNAHFLIQLADQLVPGDVLGCDPAEQQVFQPLGRPSGIPLLRGSAIRTAVSGGSWFPSWKTAPDPSKSPPGPPCRRPWPPRELLGSFDPDAAGSPGPGRRICRARSWACTGWSLRSAAA